MLPLFAVTLFVSATLLFLVQPMIGKMILPRLGGTPAVWNTCMVFFQAVLLIGYAWTHTLSTWRDRRRQILVQAAILALPFLFLPFSLGAWEPPADENPVLHVLWLLLGLVGLPFFVVSTSAPLLQRWFSDTDHPAAKDPYFLYGASNLGSMLALVLYPLVVEPLFPVPDQAWVWTLGYCVFISLVVLCAVAVWNTRSRMPILADGPTPQVVAQTSAAIQAEPRAKRHYAYATPRTEMPDKTADGVAVSKPITLARRLRWIGLSAVPSSLMLGVTTYLTTDIAAIPFFWVVPLALYLLTFILVFSRWPVVWTQGPHQVVLYIQPCALMILVTILIINLAPGIALAFFIHCAAFFFTALMCHGELARDRPEPRHLTEFFLWLSVGGVLGGLFNALFAPLVFRMGNIEYPAAMVAACFLRPRLLSKETLIPGDTNEFETTRLGRVLDYVIPVLITLVALGGAMLADTGFKRRLFLAMPIMLTLALLCRPMRLGLSLMGLFAVVSLVDRLDSPLVFQDRGFFGFVKVRRDEATNEAGEVVRVYHTLVHGGINHGMQDMDKKRRRAPITYFHPTSGIGQIFERMKWPDARLPASIVAMGTDPMSALVNLRSEPAYAVVGLGIGTLASHARPLQDVHFYEIDPLIRRLSRPEKHEGEPLFFYVKDADDRHANVDIIMGDGRLQMEKKAPEGYYHVIVLDAFSSDAIPVHLLTAEAIDLYLKKLAPGGVLIFNATNRYVDITHVLRDLGDSRGLVCYYRGNGSDGTPTQYSSDWVVLQRAEYDPDEGGLPPLEDIVKASGLEWKMPDPSGHPIWTDGYSNLLRAIIWRSAPD